jgi:GNAT superfamily N-acetyltransferase
VHDVALPGGVRLRDIESDDDWDRVRTMADLVWGTDSSWVNDSLRAEQRARPDLMTATVVEDSASGAVLSYAVLRLTEGSSFCGLWGGSTLPEWRRRGLYRALVSHRARAAVEQGVPYARVDTTAASRPILGALGMHAVCATRPWILEPAVSGDVG